MSVLIKGFPLPNNCGACPLRLAWCRERIYMVTRPERCPLVPVPPHGDLIERDAAYDKIAEQEGGNYVDMDAVGMGLNETPTIIEAEEAAQKDGGQNETLSGPYDLLYEEGGYNGNGI